MGTDWKRFEFVTEATPESKLLAFTLLLRAAMKGGGEEQILVDLPRQVYQSLPPDTFRSIFSDLLIERDPGIESRLQIRVVDDVAFSYGRLASDDR